MKKLKTNEQTALQLLNQANITSLDLWCLVEIGSELDADSEEIALTANHVQIVDNEVYLADNGYSGEVWKFSELSVPVQQDVIWTIKQTLGLN